MTATHVSAPEENPETTRFWAAAREGRLLYGHCRSCNEPHYYPRSLCPHCFSAETEWRQGSGDGTIYTYSVMRRADPPYAIAYVTLAEGVSMLTNLVDCDFDKLSIGQKVKLVFKPSPGQGAPLPMFTVVE